MNLNEETRQINLRINADKKKAFQAACLAHDMRMNHYLEVSVDYLINLDKLTSTEAKNQRGIIAKAQQLAQHV